MWTPITPVTRNASGSRMERSTCDSAAKLSTASTSAHEVVHDIPVGDVADHEPQACVHLRVGADRRQVGLVAGVGQLVEDGDLGAVAPAENVADVARPDEPGPAGHEEASVLARGSGAGVRGWIRGDLGHPIGRSDGGFRRPMASSSRASSDARSSDGTVPASVQWPSYTRVKSRPSGM